VGSKICGAGCVKRAEEWWNENHTINGSPRRAAKAKEKPAGDYGDSALNLESRESRGITAGRTTVECTVTVISGSKARTRPAGADTSAASFPTCLFAISAMSD
jgi:hypothetical protein